MEQSKLLSTVMGGVATTDDPELARALAKLQGGAVPPSRAETVGLALKVLAQYAGGNPWRYLWGKYMVEVLEKVVGPSTTVAEMQGAMPPRFFRRLSPLQAAIGLRQIESLEGNLNRRREIADAYRRLARKCGLQTNDHAGSSSEPSYIRYPFIVDERIRWQKAFSAVGFHLGEWLNDSIHPKGSSHGAVGYTDGQCPIAEFLADHVVNLPTHSGVNEEDIRRVDRLLGQMLSQ